MVRAYNRKYLSVIFFVILFSCYNNSKEKNIVIENKEDFREDSLRISFENGVIFKKEYFPKSDIHFTPDSQDIKNVLNQLNEKYIMHYKHFEGRLLKEDKYIHCILISPEASRSSDSIILRRYSEVSSHPEYISVWYNCRIKKIEIYNNYKNNIN